MAQENIADDVRAAVDDQIAELRTQLSSITRALSDNGFDMENLREDAGNLIDGAAKNARRAAEYAQDEVKAVAKIARKNPAGVSSALTLAALIGFGLGYAVSQMQHENQRNQWW